MLTKADGPLGLARSLLMAGVPAIVASYWPVEDRTSRNLLVRFHRAFAKTGDPVRALQQAQIDVLSQPQAGNDHPKSWAGFVVIGGWTPQVTDSAGGHGAAR
jgi:CHAT domain-containing protein